MEFSKTFINKPKEELVIKVIGKKMVKQGTYLKVVFQDTDGNDYFTDIPDYEGMEIGTTYHIKAYVNTRQNGEYTNYKISSVEIIK